MIEETITRLVKICDDFRSMPDWERVDHRIPEARGPLS
jgi:hypothetical protein